MKALGLASPTGDTPTGISQPALQNDHTYMTTTNIYNPRVAQKVFDRILEAEVTIMQYELLLLAPKIQSWISDATAR